MSTIDDQPRPLANRWLARITTAIAIGAIVTLIVATGLAYAVNLPPTGSVVFHGVHNDFYADAMMWTAPGVKRFAFTCTGRTPATYFDRALIPTLIHECMVACFDLYMKERTWPWWGRTPIPSADPTVLWAGVIQDARGWPFPALSCEWTVDCAGRPGHIVPPRLHPVMGGIDFTPASTIRSIQPNSLRAFPLRPVWPGLIADIAFYAAIWTFASIAVRRTRAFLRLRRSRCPSCGYSLAGQNIPGCPECGWERARLS